MPTSLLILNTHKCIRSGGRDCSPTTNETTSNDILINRLPVRVVRTLLDGCIISDDNNSCVQSMC